MFTLIRLFGGILSFLGAIAILALLTTAAAPLIILILILVVLPGLLSGIKVKKTRSNQSDLDAERKHRSEELYWASQNMEYEFEAKKRKAEWQNQK
jgi:hypothetical protein